MKNGYPLVAPSPISLWLLTEQDGLRYTVHKHSLALELAKNTQFPCTVEPLYEGPEKGYVRFDIPAAECFTCDHFDYTMYTCMDCERSDYAPELIEHKEDCRVAAALKQL